MSGLEFLAVIPELAKSVRSLHCALRTIKEAPKEIRQLADDFAIYTNLLEFFGDTLKDRFDDGTGSRLLDRRHRDVGMSIETQGQSIIKDFKSLFPTVEFLAESSKASVLVRAIGRVVWRWERPDFQLLMLRVISSKCSVTFFLTVLCFKLKVDQLRASNIVTDNDKRDLYKLSPNSPIQKELCSHFIFLQGQEKRSSRDYQTSAYLI